MNLTRRRMILATAALLALAAVATGSVWGVLATRNASADPDPVHWSVVGGGWSSWNLQSATSKANRIVEGTVRRSGPSVWTTSDGTRQGMTGRELKNAGYMIVTPYEITPSKTWKGPNDGQPFTVYQLGGQAGQDVLEVDDALNLVRDGESGIFFTITGDETLKTLSDRLEAVYAATDANDGVSNLYDVSPQRLTEIRGQLDAQFGNGA